MFNPVKSFTDLARPSTAILCKIFLSALAIRWAYALILYTFMGEEGLKGVDSYTYVNVARDFAEAVKAGAVHGPQWFGEYPYTMPLFHWLAAIPFLIFGSAHGTIAYVLMQGLFDSGTCLAVYGIARRLSSRIAITAAIVAIFNPTQIVLSGLFYTDTPFVFFVALAFYASLRWLDISSFANASLLGFSLGCAALVRALIVPWAFFALMLIAFYVLFRKYRVKQFSTLSAALITLCLCVSVILAKNITLYKTAGLTSQSGIHLALWVVPLAKEMQDRTPFMTSFNDIEQRTMTRFGPHSFNPFEQSRRYTIIAQDALKEIYWGSIVKSWLSGMAINLASPAILISPPVAQIPRPGFYNTPGSSFFDKAINYAFRSGQPVYTSLLLLGSIGLAAMCLLQLFGVTTLAHQAKNWPALIFMVSWVGYILLINGPVASPKYRLPLEPLFNIAAGAGIVSIYDWRNRKSAKRNETLAHA